MLAARPSGLALVACTFQVLAEAGMAKAVAFDEIDKAPEEKARGITIATAHGEVARAGRAALCPAPAAGPRTSRGGL